jgi:hypothetical protein
MDRRRFEGSVVHEGDHFDYVVECEANEYGMTWFATVFRGAEIRGHPNGILDGVEIQHPDLRGVLNDIVEFSERRAAPFAAQQRVRASVCDSAGFTTCRRGKAPRHCPWMALDWGCRALTPRGWRGRGYGLVDADTPKRARLARAIQVSFLELLSQFPSETDFL